MYEARGRRSYRTREPLRVVAEILDWELHAPEILQDMRNHLEKLKRLGIGAINDSTTVQPQGRVPVRRSATLTWMSRIFTTSFASVYPHYVTKVEKKGRTRAELDQVIEWLTGFDESMLSDHLDAGTTFEGFFAVARLNPHAPLITGVVCGVRVEDVADPLMRKIRYLDKLVDELAKGNVRVRRADARRAELREPDRDSEGGVFLDSADAAGVGQHRAG